MTSRLSILRSQLARLRGGRVRLRAAAAWSALAIALFAVLDVFFALDLIFELAIAQRCVVLLLGALAVAWAYRRFSAPLLRTREDEIEMALLVQRDQHIDSDLVAALQFESPGAEHRGSGQLQTAVIEYVAAAGHGIELLDAGLRKEVQRRISLLSLLLSVALMICILWPGHVSALLRRLAFSTAHYPTRTTIEQLFVNQVRLLERSTNGSRPRESNGAQGKPLTFLVQCTGDLPSAGTCQLTMTSESNRRSRLKLTALSLDERRSRLQSGLQQLTDAIQKGLKQLPPPQLEELKSLVGPDSPSSASALAADNLPAAATAVSQTLESWPVSAANSALLSGRLEQLNSSLQYKLSAGDAWTEPAAIHMIPLPIIELEAQPVPPAYAAGQVEPPAASRQFAVLEGSALRLAIRCLNEKRLDSAWIVVQSKQGTHKYDLHATANDGTRWAPPANFAPLANIREELRFEIQAIDVDGLSLESPIRGTVRIKPDRAPLAVAGTIHRLVLPAAAPLIHYKATDDFGISRLTLVVEIQRAPENARPSAASTPGVSLSSQTTGSSAVTQAPSRRYELLASGSPMTGNQLPVVGKFPLPLSDLPLTKGDRLKLTLEVIDYRGQNEQGLAQGVSSQADPLVLEVSDEAGVLAAIAEADPRSAERLNDLINRELSIGDSP